MNDGSCRRAFTLMDYLVAAALLAILVPMFLVATRTAEIRADRRSSLTRCQANLRQLGIALRSYAVENGNALPVSPTLEGPHATLVAALLNPGLIDDARLFFCPGRTDAATSGDPGKLAQGKIGYYSFSATAPPGPETSEFLRTSVAWPRRISLAMDGGTWVMSDIWVRSVPTAHSGMRKGVNYLTLDGAVSFVSESPRKSFR